jgi:hypothetical protein
MIYGALSLAADPVKVALPLVAILLWLKQHRVLATLAALFCAGVICYSLAAAIGFAASTRGATVTANKATVDNRKAWEARIERTAQQLDQLGVPRPAGVIQAEIEGLLRTPGADDCATINGPVTKEICPKVDALRKELAASQRAAELEAGLVADRKRLQTVPVAASVADPQSATLSRLTALSESNIRDMIAFLIAGLVEMGSTLGFTFAVLASRSVMAAPAPIADMPVEQMDPEPTAEPQPEPVTRRTIVKFQASPGDAVARWAYSRIDVFAAGRIQAQAAYQDFVAWCEEEGIEPCSRQMFGRRLTEVVAGMGGRKVKINGRAYYEGVSLHGCQPQRQVLAMAA